MATEAPALTVAEASLRYDRFQALNAVSFSARRGELVTLLGPSGCGKTTLLRAIAGFIPLDSGRIEIDGRDMAGLSPERRDTAMCFQSYALFPHLTVADNIGFGLRQKRLSSAEIADRVSAVAAQVRLSAQLERLPAQLSGGQQQRVALARAMAVRPGVMLFDEPLSNLDAKLRDQVRAEIRALQRAQGFTAVYVTHDQAEALAMSDLVVVMRAGVVEQMGTPEDIYRRPANRFVADFIGTANILAGRVMDTDKANGLYRVETPMGMATVRAEAPPVASHVYLCWRPEDARILSSTEGEVAAENVYRLQVRSRTYLGNLVDLEVGRIDGEGETWRIQTHGTSAVMQGETVAIEIAPERFRFLSEAVT
ncbi:ABC transporter ATP-binding protein [Rhizobium sp. C4]|uniref:ABC transporter ATP-binding protein n=1 Tax=Rhizobium sp. C4 TaxID=1349800 RepID=UPI001E3302ED|nr:ABC transporter ATP-binding protein [Rhizobium sp. C4]MCD2172283.1 ABC transporter ATP-binding protein [Rhizobium sp. C4]